jgi:uncharacterized OB-fold protein
MSSRPVLRARSSDSVIKTEITCSRCGQDGASSEPDARLCDDCKRDEERQVVARRRIEDGE